MPTAKIPPALGPSMGVGIRMRTVRCRGSYPTALVATATAV